MAPTASQHSAYGRQIRVGTDGRRLIKNYLCWPLESMGVQGSTNCDATGIYILIKYKKNASTKPVSGTDQSTLRCGVESIESAAAAGAGRRRTPRGTGGPVGITQMRDKELKANKSTFKVVIGWGVEMSTG